MLNDIPKIIFIEAMYNVYLYLEEILILSYCRCLLIELLKKPNENDYVHRSSGYCVFLYFLSFEIIKKINEHNRRIFFFFNQ